MQKVHAKPIYLDSASTTRVYDDIVQDANTLMKEYYGNADSLHALGQRVSALVKRSRESVAQMLGVLSHEVIFTSSGSEANVSAIKGIVFSHPDKKHIITSQIEHASVLETMKQLERVFHYEVTYLPVNDQGVVAVEDLKKNLRSDTVLVALMSVNNEVGSIFPIQAYAEVIKKYSDAYFHVDGVQAFGKEGVNLKQVDSFSISAHKLGGLKGSGVLIKKANVPFEPLITAGQQEFGLRGGTVDSVSAILFSKTMRLALEDRQKNYDKIKRLNQYLWDAFENIEGVQINSKRKGTPYIFNVSIENVGSEIMMNALNAKHIYVSAKSTCHSEKNQPSHVLKAIGLSDKQALSSIRISLSSEIELEDLEKTVNIILETKNYVQH